MSKKETKKSYISWDDNDVDSLDKYQQVNDLTFYFIYHDPFLIYKKLDS